MNYCSLSRLLPVLAITFCLPFAVLAQDEVSFEKTDTPEVVRVSLSSGAIHGQVFTMLDNQKAPLVGKVSLTDLDGETISTLTTDEDGNFSFKDIEPGKYKAIGVAGDYVGDTEIEVTVDENSEESEEGFYTAIPLAVAPASSNAIFESYASLPASSFSTTATPAIGGYQGGCGSYSTGCGSGGCGGGVGFRTFGSCGGGCGGCCGGGLFGGGFGRLALIGGAIAIPLAVSDASPDN